LLLSEHVLAQRRGERLVLRNIDAAARARAEAIARELVGVAQAHLGGPRGELEAALAAVDALPKDAKLKAGLVKLVLDRCEFEAAPPIPPEQMRHELFSRAAAERREHGHLDRGKLVADVAAAHHLAPEELERALYADLKASHTLVAFDAIAPAALAEALVRGQAQAVLLRAERVAARIRCKSPGTLRAILRTLKFHRLLFTVIAGEDGAHVLGIDGPMSLFDAGTKYGPRLAMALPALESADELELEANVRWGKERQPLLFSHRHALAGGAKLEEAPLPDEVEALRAALDQGGSGLQVRRSKAVLNLPGVGVCVPDLELSQDGRVVYVEVLGFWSREAVWRRVELAEKGLGARVLFCVSSRLRVSEEVLPDELPAALYVYKGAMSARTVAERARKLLARDLKR
jgi:predicted nuclease of restriction endonuclease-like RecB superfamily